MRGFISARALGFAALVFCLPWSNLAGLGRQESAPLIQMQDQPRQYIAPGNPNAQARSLTLPFSSLTFTAQGEVIKSWTFTVFDSSGLLVSKESRLETRDRGFFGELFNIGPRPQVEIPKELSWDGAYHLPGREDDGKLVPDGNYTYQITILDSAGGRAQTPPFHVTVKNAPVTVNYLRIPQAVFSPLGARKTVTVDQSGSREFRWEGRFLNAQGQTVRRVVWENTGGNQALDVAPPPLIWDGRDDLGQVLPDGVYRYELQGSNRAGARLTVAAEPPVTISERSGAVQLQAAAPRFSPAAEGAPQTLGLIPNVGSTEGILKWTVRVADAGRPDQTRWTQSGLLPLPDQVSFAGRSTGGLPLPEGHYQATLSVLYDNGNSTESAPVPFDLLLTPPQASLSVSDEVFGGTGRAGVTVRFQGEPGLTWSLEVLSAAGTPVRRYSLGDTGTATLEFQGLDEAGQALPDGTYSLRASARNAAGIPGAFTAKVRKDSRPMPLTLELSNTVMVPGRAGQESLRLTPHYQVVDSVARTSLKVTDAAGTVVLARQSDSITPYWDWRGLTDDGKRVPDGVYRVEVTAAYSNGTESRASAPVTVDSHFLDNAQPTAALTLSSRIFSPVNVDGPRKLTIVLEAREGSSPLTDWSLQVLDPRGKPFRLFSGRGAPPAQVVWDGLSDARQLVESGEEYALVFTVGDQARRTAQAHDAVTTDILVDKLPDGRFKIVISAIQFAGYSSDLFKVGEPLLAKNLFVLRRLADVLNRLPDYGISLEGYAVSEFSTDPRSAQWEQNTQLIPLSRDRALEVKAGLVLLGVEASRFGVQGFGAQRPLVPDTDLENRWKNRRVEFYLEKAR